MSAEALMTLEVAVDDQPGELPLLQTQPLQALARQAERSLIAMHVHGGEALMLLAALEYDERLTQSLALMLDTVRILQAAVEESLE